MVDVCGGHQSEKLMEVNPHSSIWKYQSVWLNLFDSVQHLLATLCCTKRDAGVSRLRPEVNDVEHKKLPIRTALLNQGSTSPFDNTDDVSS
jgi:hypothetical protein